MLIPLFAALELLCLLVKYEEVQQSILTGLVGILKLQEDATNSMTKLSTSEISTKGNNYSYMSMKFTQGLFWTDIMVVNIEFTLSCVTLIFLQLLFQFIFSKQQQLKLLGKISCYCHFHTKSYQLCKYLVLNTVCSSC